VERTISIEDYYYIWQPIAGALAVFGQRADPAAAEPGAALPDQRVEHGQQPVHPLPFVGGDHAPGVRESGQRAQSPAREVQAVQLQVGGRKPVGQADREAAQRLGLAGATRPVDQYVSIVAKVEPARRLRLGAGLVQQPDRGGQLAGPGRCVQCAQLVQRDDGWQRVEPGPGWGRYAQVLVSGPDRGYEALQVGGPVVVPDRA
jgi:hypothetical protein